MDQYPLLKNKIAQLPASEIPSIRIQAARDRSQLLFKTWGGIGDQVCAEPTLRYALKKFKNVQISLASEYPELFRHLKFKKVYDLRHETPAYEDYLVFNTGLPAESLSADFISHSMTHCVDFASIAALRCMLPVPDRAIQLHPQVAEDFKYKHLAKDLNLVFVHPGKHWPTKTFPAAWWDEVLSGLIGKGFLPVLIGRHMAGNQSTVEVDTRGTLDLRNLTTLEETAWLLKYAEYLVTNDSSPLHLAAAGAAEIAFIPTAKHPDLITHWRLDEDGDCRWGWNMQAFYRGGIWDEIDGCPNQLHDTMIDQCTPEQLASWLPEPEGIWQYIWRLRRTNVKGI